MRRIYQISIVFAIVLGYFSFLVAVHPGPQAVSIPLSAARNHLHDPPHRNPDVPCSNYLGGGFDDTFTSVLKSVFPIDSVIFYNTSNSSTCNMIARYASFSHILKHELTGQFAIVPGNGCHIQPNDVVTSFSDKILIVQRGECSFVEKVENLLASSLSPRAIIIANNIPQGDLITMYHRTFNHDGATKTPMLFISLEDYEVLKSLESYNASLSISTVALDSIMGISLSMALAPPIMFLLFYLTIRLVQYYRHRRMSVMNERYVAQLPVYMYRGNHLIPCSNFYEYLKSTKQTEDVPFISSSFDDVATEEVEASSDGDNLVINGTDIYSLKHLSLLFSKTDYYPTSKCSICLGRLVPLQSRVLLLHCKHMYHEKCLSNWLINFKKSCPLCNKIIRLNEESTTYGTFVRDLEAALDEDFLGQEDVLLRDDTDGESRSILHGDESLSAPHISTSTPLSAHSYVSMPILPIRPEVSGSPSVSTISGSSYVTTRSKSIEVIGTSVESEYLTPLATNDSSADDERTETAQSVSSTLSYQSH